MTRSCCAVVALAVLAVAARAELPASPPTAVARVALIADVHVRQATNTEQAQAHARFHRVIADVNAAGVALVLVAGDLTEFGRPDEIRAFREHMAAFDAPAWYVPGNHDIGRKQIQGKLETNAVSTWRVRYYESRLGPSFFARTRAGVRVIGINSPILGSGLPKETQMWAFLERELARPSAEPTILLTHYPPFHKAPDEPGGEYWNIEPEPRQRLLALIKSGGVQTVLSGHVHTQRVNRHEGVLWLTTPPVSFGLPKEKQAEGWMLLSVPRQGPAQFEFRPVAR